MRSFLASHIHWLWSLLHTAKNPYSLQTLLLFVFVGALQITVAVEGGALAAEALNTGDKRKRYLKVEFWLLGLMLFGATVWTGLLNDQSQKASDGRADDLKTELTQLSNSVVTDAQLRAEIAKLPANATSTPAGEKLYSQLQQAINQTNELAHRYSTLPNATSGPGSQPPTPSPNTQLLPDPISQPQGTNVMPTSASVRADIEKTISRLANIDRNADSSVQMTLSGVRSQYVFGGGANEASRDAAFQATVPRLSEIIKGRDASFQLLMPEIIRERSEALRLLAPTPSDSAADKAAFDNAVAISNGKITIPNSWLQAGGLYMLKYNDMDAYLSTLDQRLKAIP
jgi:hypothetical protein